MSREELLKVVETAIDFAEPGSRAKAALAALRFPPDEMLEASWLVVRNATPQERIRCELASPKNAHIHKMRQRWQAMVNWCLATDAQGIEARSDTTGTGVAEGESPVAKPCAQKETP